tara:strand:- start:4025 stop:5665 length:1641 start_codon:yes stop_codon:yes gene_type:complete
MTLIDVLHQSLDCSKIDILPASEASEKYGQTTLKLGTFELYAAIIVKDVSIISDLLQLANTELFYLHPISSGNNWGYGSINAQLQDRKNIVLDLGQLKKITPTDKELGLITLQPGVSQQELYDYLTVHNWPFMTPVTGAGPSCSIVSNALERGYGITPRTDHFAAVNAIKAYLPHPDLCKELFESSISAMDKSGDDFIDKTFKWGLGPYLDGLFTQSNLGIVTEMTIRLAPTPTDFCSFYLKVSDPSKFSAAVSIIKETLLNFEGAVGSINLMDRRRLVSMTSENPNGRETHKNMSNEQVLNLANKSQLPEWMVVGSIYGNQDIINAVKKQIRKKAKHIGSIFFSNSLLMKFAYFFFALPLPKTKLIETLRLQLHSMKEGTDIMLGKPNQVALPLAYWRNPTKSADKRQALNPAKDQCGLLWYAPLLPMKAEKLSAFVNLIRSVTPKYGIEPLITFTNLRHDCIDSTVPIVFNLEDEEAVKAAHLCLEELILSGNQLGFTPYRLSIDQQQALDASHIFWKTNKLIKTSLDPNNIISPLRYAPQTST